MRVYFFTFLFFLIIDVSVFAQYTMSNQTVYDCEGTLTDSEANTLNPGWYDHNENFSFTICPNGALSITIDFNFFSTEPNNDYVMIYDGPNSSYPVLGGPFSGVNLPPQIVSSGCVTIVFISDVNVAAEGFGLTWNSNVSVPLPPTISLISNPTCSTTILNLQLDQNMHCDSVYTAQITVGGQINQIVNAIPINCIADSTSNIELTLFPGLNESGLYDLFFQSFFIDDCDSVWNLSSTLQIFVNDCPLELDLVADNDSICLGDCTNLFALANGGDSTSYIYTWNPIWSNSSGPQNVCPTVTTSYIVSVDDAGPATPQTDTIIITVLPPPTTQGPISICQTDPAMSLIASPSGGVWWGTGIIDGTGGVFSPNGLTAGVYNVNYGYGGCSDDLDVTVLAVEAGPDISTCLNAPTFNLNTAITTAGGTWTGCNCIQPNGDITVGNSAAVITAVYTLPNGCSDTLLVNVGGITTQLDDTICQQQGNYNLSFSPANGVWSVFPDNTLQVSSCPNAIDNFPFEDNFELGIGNWNQDPTNDFDWTVNSGITPSGGTGPSQAYDGYNYIYTEASNPNHPSKKAAIISPCLNLSAYNNPVLHFLYHKYGVGQGSFAVDISVDNGLSWSWNHWYVTGDLGNQWNEAAIDLSNFNSTEVLIRLRVITGDWQSDVAVDNLSILAGPVTTDGTFLSNVSNSGLHNLIYSIQGCEDYVDIYVKEIDAGSDQLVCPSEPPFNLSGSPASGIWSGSNIINTTLGTYDPSLGLGIDVVTYSVNGCIDTTEIRVVDTEIQINNIDFCINEGVKQLTPSLIPRDPYNGIWSGTGITNINYPGEFSPALAGSGTHIITYTANNCSDQLTVTVHPNSMLADTLICSSSPDIFLNVTPSGGSWYGNGIIDNSTGLFSPSSLPIGVNFIGYQSLDGCIDTFAVQIYSSPILEMNGLTDFYCFIDTNIQVIVNPLGGVLSGNGINGNSFNPSIAGSGYHLITYSYGNGNCLQTIDTVVLVGQQLIATTYQTEDTICSGNIVSIGVNASGGSGNYIFDWSNGLSNSFQQLVEPISSTNYVIQVSDGCSDDILDTIKILVQPTFDASFTTSARKCFGSTGYAKVSVSPNTNNYSFEWNTDPIHTTDSLLAEVNKIYQVEITDVITGCSILDTITIPGYDNLLASFFSNTTECVSILSSDFQFIDNSILNPNQLLSSSFWDFGDGHSIPYSYGINPIKNYTDTGIFPVTLYLENIGGCSDSAVNWICIVNENKLFIPNSFTPNSDNCNDVFYAKGLGNFFSFNIKIYKRWGSEAIFESSEIVYSDHATDGNVCNHDFNLGEYYKMGAWDGKLSDKTDAPMGVYVFLVDYKQTEFSDIQTIKGVITLIR